MLGIIGGSGLNEIECFDSVGEELIPTPYSDTEAAVQLYRHGDHKVAFLPRHGKGHVIPPHKINYRANIWALKQLGIEAVIAVNAVGAINSKFSPGSLAVPDQIIDYTHDREHSFSDGDLDEVVHVDFTHPYSNEVRELLLQSINTVKDHDEDSRGVIQQGVYGCVQGPRLETAAEIRRFQRDGCDMVGMTGMPEAALARELDLQYACLAISVNWAAGLSDHLISMDEISQSLTESMRFVNEVLMAAVEQRGS